MNPAVKKFLSIDLNLLDDSAFFLFWGSAGRFKSYEDLAMTPYQS